MKNIRAKTKSANNKTPHSSLLTPPFSFLLLLLFISCAEKIPVSFPSGGLTLYGLSRQAAGGTLELGRPKKLRYVFDRPLNVSPASLEIEYAFSRPLPPELTGAYHLVLQAGEGNSWVLPWDASFLSPEGGEVFCYGIPYTGPALGEFTIALTPRESGEAKKIAFPGTAPPQFTARSFTVKNLWYGFVREPGEKIRATPFVYRKRDQALVIDPPPGRLIPGGMELRAVRGAGFSGPLELDAGARRFEAGPGTETLFIPPGALGEPGPLTLTGEGVSAFYLAAAEAPLFPEPVPADPGIMLAYPQEAWRDRRFEIFRWDRFPSILVFDTADYALQNRLFKRLCFFVEKKGFRGRLAHDREIADLHGWNAHDYRAEDLARFFDAAADFPLSPEERELEQILFTEGIIRRREGRIIAGEGAVLSLSRQSADYLRFTFMAHEGFHGLFFIDGDFRAFSRRRWEGLSRQAKIFIRSYFDYQSYDTGDEYLMVNELMAHCLQQPVSQAPRYFGETLASRIHSSPWRREALPEKDEASGSWPELGRAFRIEAEAFSEYVNQRWGLSAGRVWDVQVR
ncbi:MAG: hypothetical protein LBE14_02550 [Treponema sp.]|jgi:hypothetical protein|nr:hypothetical protein [Treponema sp.]